MGKRSQVLISTDRQVTSAKPPAAPEKDATGKRRWKWAEYRIAGTPNLILRVAASGNRSWLYYIKRPQTSRWAKYSIGPYPAVGLAAARDEAIRLKRLVIDGIDPFAVRSFGLGAPSVEALGKDFIARYAKPRKRSWREDERKLERDVYPVLGQYRADLVTKQDIVKLVDGIAGRGAGVHANRTLALLRKLYNWAAAEGCLTTVNPCAGLPMRAPERARKRTLSEDELREFWLGLDGHGFDEVTPDALRLQLLLGARIREVTDMTRTELALAEDTPLWTLPAVRSKGNRHVPRPLPELALAIVRRRLEVAEDEGSAFVFASPFDAGQPIIAQAPTRAVKRAADRALIPGGFTPHDLRRTCRTFWAKLGIGETVAKKILGHVPPRSDVTASVYDQHDYIDEMLEALKKWEDKLLKIVSLPKS